MYGADRRALEGDGDGAAGSCGWVVECCIASTHEEAAVVEDHLVVGGDGVPCATTVDGIGEGSEIASWIEVACEGEADILERG